VTRNKNKYPKNQKIRDYLDSLPLPERKLFIEACGKSQSDFNQIVSGARGCSLEMAIRMDKNSFGQLKARDICTDSIDWQYLKDSLNA
jgi:hypothetical protein